MIEIKGFCVIIIVYKIWIIKISDFTLVCKSLQILCKRLDCDFVNLNVSFVKDEKTVGLQNDCICLNSNATLIDTMSNIYSIYINNLSKICGRNIDNFDFRNAVTNYFMAMLRDFSVQYKNKDLEIQMNI
jgi:hypothetical protein